MSIRNNFRFIAHAKPSVLRSDRKNVILRSFSNFREISIKQQPGCLTFTLQLPASHQFVHVTLNPRRDTVGDFVGVISSQDKSVKDVRFKCSDGIPYSNACKLIDVLCSLSDLTLQIDDDTYVVPKLNPDSCAVLPEADQLKNLLVQLQLTLNQHQPVQHVEKLKLELDLETLKQELLPLEKENDRLVGLANRSANRLLWLGLGLMGFQFGGLARLVWYEYSWDIIEPVSYFVTYSSVIAGYAYYLITKQQNNYDVMESRAYRTKLHRLAARERFDIDRLAFLRRRVQELTCLLEGQKASDNSKRGGDNADQK